MKKKEKNNFLKQSKGITLVSLVVTIIVLIILAGVSIGTLFGENGIITMAKKAKENVELSQIKEQTELNELYAQMESEVGESGGISYDAIAKLTEFRKKIAEAITNEGIETSETDSVETMAENIGKLGLNSEDAYNSGYSEGYLEGLGTHPYLPSTYFTEVEGTNLDTGLVIQDGDGNQYVWIEVPRIQVIYQTAGIKITEFTDDELTRIETDLQTYAKDYRLSGWTDEYYADSTSGWFANAAAYNTAKNNMLKSVYKNGGFYIGRYETGIAYNDANSYRTASGNTTQTPVIKANAYPYNYVTRTQAQVLASSMNSGNYTSSLMFGVQWDLVLKYLETKGATQEELKGTTTGSTGWGNYKDAKFSVISTNAKYAILDQDSYVLGSWNSVPTDYEKPNSGTENWVLLSTGANETRNSKQNICDLAGNVWEWTLEKTSNTNYPCAIRGGVYSYSGCGYPVSYRNDDSTADSNYHIGFRVSLY